MSYSTIGDLKEVDQAARMKFPGTILPPFDISDDPGNSPSNLMPQSVFYTEDFNILKKQAGAKNIKFVNTYLATEDSHGEPLALTFLTALDIQGKCLIIEGPADNPVPSIDHAYAAPKCPPDYKDSLISEYYQPGYRRDKAGINLFYSNTY